MIDIIQWLINSIFLGYLVILYNPVYLYLIYEYKFILL